MIGWYLHRYLTKRNTMFSMIRSSNTYCMDPMMSWRNLSIHDWWTISVSLHSRILQCHTTREEPITQGGMTNMEWRSEEWIWTIMGGPLQPISTYAIQRPQAENWAKPSPNPTHRMTLTSFSNPIKTKKTNSIKLHHTTPTNFTPAHALHRMENAAKSTGSLSSPFHMPLAELLLATYWLCM
jgi:hypothetical protein